MKTYTTKKRIFHIYTLLTFVFSSLSVHVHSFTIKENPKFVSQKNLIDKKTEKGLKSGNDRLILKQEHDGFSLFIYHGPEEIGRQTTPARITILETDNTTSKKYIEKVYSQAYNHIEKKEYGFCATAHIYTEKGSILSVEDKYTLVKEGVFAIYRKVKVNHAEKEDIGYASTISINISQDSAPIDNYEYFIPAILYKDTRAMRKNAIAAYLNVERMYVKETRTGLPLAMIRKKGTGHTLTLTHYKPCIEVGQHPGGGTHNEINDALQYGAIGYTMHPSLSVDFHYPCSEGPRTYEPRDQKGSDTNWSKRYHPIKKDYEHHYSVSLIPQKNKEYNEAMTYAFNTAYTIENPPVFPMDMEEIYQQNISLFKAEHRTFGNGNIQAAGLPWSLDLPDGSNKEGVSFQMGFVGQQIAVGYHMYRYGLDYMDLDAKTKGAAIIDFWTSSTIMDTYFPTVWWDPANNQTAGQRRIYPCFLRCLVDGMEGLLDACRISAAYGEKRESWHQALVKTASNLVRKQNADGSFYRAYKTNGEVETKGDRNTHGTSKLNTPIAIRFLVKMYEYTGEKKYKEAAIKAAEFSYNELYLNMGKYVGGTPDNPNTIDKEAAIYALYGFNAIQELTGNRKYLQAAEHAASCAMSWTYCYDFSIPNRNSEDLRKNPFSKGGVIGFSIIATGHSGADNFMAYTFYEIYKLYIKTGKELYLHMARFLQNNTKLNTDYDGRMGYKYRAFMPEATNVADLAFRSVSLWLPWSSIANIEPIIHLEEAFGEKDLNNINLRLTKLRKKLTSYGIGGKPLQRQIPDI